MNFKTSKLKFLLLFFLTPLYSCEHETVVYSNPRVVETKVVKVVKVVKVESKLQNEIEHIKRFEGFREKPYNKGKYETIGYGFLTRYWYNDTIITKDSADVLLAHIYKKLYTKANKDYPNSTEKERIAHLYFWLGVTGANGFIENDTIQKFEMYNYYSNNKGLLKRAKHFL